MTFNTHPREQLITGWKIGIRIPAGTEMFSLHYIKTDSEGHPASPVGTEGEGCFLGDRAAGM
jgi:hypothetical protein